MAKKNGQALDTEILEKILGALEKQTAETRIGCEKLSDRIDGVSGRIDTLAKSTTNGFTRLETRLDVIAKNTGARHRKLEARLRVVEERLGIDSE